MNAFFFSLGCKVNQYELEYFRNQLKSFDINSVKNPEQADIIVINTCAVTQKAASKSKQAIKKLLTINPHAFFIITGCYAQLNPEELRRIEGVDLILGNLEKRDLKIFFKRFYKSKKFEMPIPFVKKQIHECNFPYDHHVLTDFNHKTRALVQIQDGCEQFCTYCIVPYLRGKYRSRSSDDIISEIQVFEQKGFQEVVLTGIHIGKYGIKTNEITFKELLLRILEETNMPRIRLSSIEPNEIDDELISIIADHERICNHFHIPLQSGNDKILKRMKRGYTTTQYEEIIHKLKERIPTIGIGVDLILGFPGECDTDFDTTYQFIKNLPPLYLHVFSYSDRPGTEAEKFQPKVSRPLIKQRVEKMVQLGKFKKHEFYKKAIDSHIHILVESHSKKNGYQQGLTDNYIRSIFKSDSDLSNQIIRVKADFITEDGFMFSSIP